MSSPKPKRPKNRPHHSSFIDRLHRLHDERRHPGGHQQAEEIAPLLREERPSSDTASHAEELAGSLQQSTDAPGTGQLVIDVARRFSVTAVATRGAILEVSKKAVSKIEPVVKNNSKRILGGICVLLAILAAGEAINIYNRHPPFKSDICNTPACIHAASDILQNLHPSILDDSYLSSGRIDPCDDFDQYVCGGFRIRHDLREDQSDLSTATIMTEDVQSTLRHVLEQDQSAVSSADQEIFAKVKDAYVACTNQELLRGFGIKPLKTIANEIKMLYSGGRVPLRKTHSHQFISDSGTNAIDSLTAVFTHMMQLGVSAFVSLNVRPDDKAPETQTIFASPVRPIGLPVKELYNSLVVTSEYRQIIASTLEHFYDTIGNSSVVLGKASGIHYTIHDLAQGIVTFESKVAAIIPEEVDLANISKAYNMKTYDEFESLMPPLSIKSIVREFAPASYNASTLVVTSPIYLQNLSTIISTTSTEVIQAFMVWKAVQKHAERAEHEALNSWKQFSKKLAGKSTSATDERWRTCVDGINTDFGWILTKFYVQDSLPRYAMELGNTIITDVKKAFDKLLEDVSWMSSEDRDRAINKSTTIDTKLGYPTKHPDILDPISLKQFYSTVMVSNNTHFENKLSAIQGNLLREWSKLGKPTDKNEWALTSTTINTYYDPSANEIIIPAGILRSPVLYDPSVPSYLSYGVFGTISGHEVSHAFDPQGSQYDQNGIYNDWWSNSTRDAFDSRASCFVDQYSKYAIDGPDGQVHVNGKMTLGENIADAGGVHAAYQAWFEKEVEQSSQMLPGLEMFNHTQLFWLSYGNWWCSKTTHESTLQRTLSDSHSPKPIRIRGTVANSRDFRKAFDCPSKTPTCELW